MTPPYPVQVQPWSYRRLLELHLQDLINQDPVSAKAVLQMSVEASPGLWSIAGEYPSNEWGTAILNGDVMNRLLKDLRPTGHLMDPPDPPISLRQILELI